MSNKLVIPPLASTFVRAKSTKPPAEEETLEHSLRELEQMLQGEEYREFAEEEAEQAKEKEVADVDEPGGSPPEEWYFDSAIASPKKDGDDDDDDDEFDIYAGTDALPTESLSELGALETGHNPEPTKPGEGKKVRSLIAQMKRKAKADKKKEKKLRRLNSAVPVPPETAQRRHTAMINKKMRSLQRKIDMALQEQSPQVATNRTPQQTTQASSSSVQQKVMEKVGQVATKSERRRSPERGRPSRSRSRSRSRHRHRHRSRSRSRDRTRRR